MHIDIVQRLLSTSGATSSAGTRLSGHQLWLSDADDAPRAAAPRRGAEGGLELRLDLSALQRAPLPSIRGPLRHHADLPEADDEPPTLAVRSSRLRIG